MPDLLLVAPDTTGGWRRACDALEAGLDELGVTYRRVAPDYRWTRPLWLWVGGRAPVFRRVASDLAQAAAMRRAATRALRREHPRALMLLSVNATLLQPRRRMSHPAAVWFDTPAALNRGPREGWVQRRLERSRLAMATMLLPLGMETGERRAAVLPDGPDVVPLPAPVERAADEKGPRERLVLAYAPVFHKKGLDLIADAWAQATPAGWTLIVSGADAEAARTYLAARGLPEPETVVWAGALPPTEHRALRTRASIVVAGSRFEDYGLAQLEALADGALLVTAPSAGPFPALDLARQLDSELVADELSGAALADALRAALAYDDVRRGAYRDRARALVGPYSHAELVARLRDLVLPRLLVGD